MKESTANFLKEEWAKLVMQQYGDRTVEGVLFGGVLEYTVTSPHVTGRIILARLQIFKRS